MKIATILALLFVHSLAWANMPVCFDRKNPMDFNEHHVLNWREFMEPKFKARAFVRGSIVKVLDDRQGHIHFEIDFDKDLKTDDDRMEIVYNRKFGALPDFKIGDALVACGDFVVDPYSPTKGVVHWLHVSPKKGAHDDGYLVINGIVTGRTTNK